MKIRTLNNLGPAFKTYITVVNDRIWKGKKLKEDDVLFKAIEEEETRIKTDHRAFANFASKKSSAKPRVRAAKAKKEFFEWLKCRKCSCKDLSDKIFKHANEECNKYYKRGHVSHFHNRYISPNKRKTPEGSLTSSFNSKKHLICVNQVVAKIMFETGLIRKIIVDSDTTQYFIANRELIRDYYDDYSEYQTRSGEILPSYRKDTLLLPFDNDFFKLAISDILHNWASTLLAVFSLAKRGLRCGYKPLTNLPRSCIIETS